jgi:chromosome segregation protein
VRGKMLDLISYDRKYDAVATYLLGDVLVVEDLERALALWRETRTTKTIVTLEGEVIDPHGVVTGGSRESALAGVLEQKREIRELEAVMERLDADVEAALGRHVAKKQAAADLGRARDEGAVALRADEMALLGQEKDLERLVEERRRLEARRAALAVQTVDLTRAREESEARLEAATTALTDDGATLEDAERRAAELRLQTVALADEVDRGVAQLTTLKVAATQATERRKNARQTLERLLADRAEDEARAARLDGTIAEDLARGEALRAQVVELRREAELAQAEAEARARAHGERQSALEARQSALAAREAELRAARAEVARLAQAASRLELRSREAGMRRSGIEEQVADRYRDVVIASVVYD